MLIRYRAIFLGFLWMPLCVHTPNTPEISRPAAVEVADGAAENDPSQERTEARHPPSAAHATQNGSQSSDEAGAQDFARGEMLFGSTCGQCHALPNPEQNVPGGWKVTIRRMERYRRNQNLRPLSGAELRQIYFFLQAQ